MMKVPVLAFGCLSMGLPSFRLSKNLLRGFWAPIYEAGMPQCMGVKWSCEHVVPKSIMRHEGVNDMHNLVLLPMQINSVRSSWKYSDDDDLMGNGTVRFVPSCGQCSGCKCDMVGKLWKGHRNGSSVFIPPGIWRGSLARAVMTMSAKYPSYSDVIYEKVMDPKTALRWNRLYPPTEDHLRWAEVIWSTQGPAQEKRPPDKPGRRTSGKKK